MNGVYVESECAGAQEPNGGSRVRGGGQERELT